MFKQSKNKLHANKLSLNESKSSFISFLCTTNTVLHSLSCFSQETVVKYLGVYIDKFLNFDKHVAYVVGRLKSFCGIVSQLRHYCPKNDLLLFYIRHIRSIIEYGISVYGNTSITVLEPIYKLQKKIIRLIYFNRSRESTSDMFYWHKILTVYELFLHNLLKYSLKTCNKMHNFVFLNNLVHRSWETGYSTRRTNKICFQNNYSKVNYCRIFTRVSYAKNAELFVGT